MILLFERAKAFHALDRAVTVIGINEHHEHLIFCIFSSMQLHTESKK
jgi:myosin heavy subunit